MMKLPKFFLKETISIRVYSGTDGFGEPVYGGVLDSDPNEIVSYASGVYQVRARVESRKNTLVATESRNVVSEFVIYYNGNDLPARSEITWGSKTVRVVECRRIMGPYGVSHLEILAQ